MGCDNGIAFVDVSDAVNPVYVGKLPTHTVASIWRGVKTMRDHAVVVSEAANHGLQVFDLRNLRTFAGVPLTFTETAHYPTFGDSHNVVADETTGYGYAVGTGTCDGGLHMIDLRSPASPSFAGCFSADGYTHDAQCVLYQGPDARFVGREICFASNEDTLTIVDVENKAAPALLSRVGYSGVGYVHQGWLTEDQSYFLVDDEFDEVTFGHGTRTYVFDVRALDAPVLVGFHTAPSTAIDHNLFIRGEYAYEANYRSGLRILDLGGVATASLSEAAYFDVVPKDDAPDYSGAWGNYPFFASGIVLVSGIEQGLFVLKPHLPPSPPAGFYTLTPCRIADTRNTPGPVGGPALEAGAARLFPVAGRCGIPPGARAAAVNITVVNPSSAGHLTVTSPYSVTASVSTLNYGAGRTRANNAVVALESGGQLRVSCTQPSGTVHFIVDVFGYFR
jgi:choice-of-anchor B domain-containing protein